MDCRKKYVKNFNRNRRFLTRCWQQTMDYCTHITGEWISYSKKNPKLFLAWGLNLYGLYVSREGLEPSTYGLKGRCSTN